MFVTVQGQRKNLLAASTKRWIGCLIGSMTPFNEQLKTVTRFVIKNIPPTGSWNEWHTNVTLQWKRCCINCDILKWFYLGSMNKSLIQLHAERRKLLQHKSDKQTAGFGPCGQNKELSICSFCWENTWVTEVKNGRLSQLKRLPKSTQTFISACWLTLRADY